MRYIRYADDCIRIQKVCLSHQWDVTLSEADLMWSRYSLSMGSTWMMLPQTTDLLWQLLEPQIEKLLEDSSRKGEK